MRWIRAVAIVALCQGCPSAAGYRTVHGLWVYPGKNNAPPRAEIEKWTAEACDWWLSVFPDWSTCATRAIDRASVAYSDSPLLGTDPETGRSRLGLTVLAGETGGMVVGNQPTVAAITRHEIGHVVLAGCTKLQQQKSHHRLMSAIGYRW